MGSSPRAGWMIWQEEMNHGQSEIRRAASFLDQPTRELSIPTHPFGGFIFALSCLFQVGLSKHRITSSE